MGKYCSKCGELLADNDIYCSRCGVNQYKDNIVNESENEFMRKSVNRKKSSHKFIFLILFSIIGFFIYDSFVVVSPEVVSESVVMIMTYDKDGKQMAQGSGFCIFENNTIVTNFHVIEGAFKIKIYTNEEEMYEVKDILIFDKKNDLAIMEGDFTFKELKFESSSKLDIEDEFLTISSPRGNLNKISPAILKDETDERLLIESDIAPGSSGGVLLNEKGKVVGVTSGTYRDENNYGYAIKIENIEELYEKFKDGNYGEISFLNKDAIFSFMPNIFDNVDGSELKIRDTWTLTDDEVYRPDSIQDFNILTNDYYIFGNILRKYPQDISYVFLNNNLIHQLNIINLYNYLKSYDRWWFSEENYIVDDTENKLKESIYEWDELQFILDMKVMTRLELAMFLDMIEDVNSYKGSLHPRDTYWYENFSIVNAKKNIVLMIISKFKPDEFSYSENISVIKFIGRNMPEGITVNEKAHIYERLGYTYENGSIYW